LQLRSSRCICFSTPFSHVSLSNDAASPAILPQNLTVMRQVIEQQIPERTKGLHFKVRVHYSFNISVLVVVYFAIRLTTHRRVRSTMRARHGLAGLCRHRSTTKTMGNKKTNIVHAFCPTPPSLQLGLRAQTMDSEHVLPAKKYHLARQNILVTQSSLSVNTLLLPWRKCPSL
jgi:hypothetical protein